jgi:elongation factor Ts
MPPFTAQDVKALRDGTGAGMMDAKRALVETDGDFDAASKWLREKGLGKAADRAGRENVEGAVAVARSGQAAAIVQLKCETDFVAKSADFLNLTQELAWLAADQGTEAIEQKRDAVDDLKVTLKENIEIGQVVRIEAQEGNVIDTYLHAQNDRGVNGIIVELAGGTEELAHDIAVTAAFTKPAHVSRDEVPAEVVDAEREQLEKETRNEGKPEAAIAKIVEGKLGGWFKRYPGGVLLDQPFFAKDEKQTVAQALGDHTIANFAQVTIGT